VGRRIPWARRIAAPGLFPPAPASLAACECWGRQASRRFSTAPRLPTLYLCPLPASVPLPDRLARIRNPWNRCVLVLGFWADAALPWPWAAATPRAGREAASCRQVASYRLERCVPRARRGLHGVPGPSSSSRSQRSTPSAVAAGQGRSNPRFPDFIPPDKSGHRLCSPFAWWSTVRSAATGMGMCSPRRLLAWLCIRRPRPWCRGRSPGGLPGRAAVTGCAFGSPRSPRLPGR
jgi:hypothetical protein